MVSGAGSSVAVGCAPSDRVAGMDKHLMFSSCHAYFSCAQFKSLEVVTSPISVSLTAVAVNMSYRLPLSHSTSHLPLRSSDFIPALKEQHKKRLKPLKNSLFDSG